MTLDPLLLLLIAFAVAVVFAVATALVRRRPPRPGRADEQRAQITSWENEGGSLTVPHPPTPSLHPDPKAPR